MNQIILHLTLSRKILPTPCLHFYSRQWPSETKSIVPRLGETFQIDRQNSSSECDILCVEISRHNQKNYMRANKHEDWFKISGSLLCFIRPVVLEFTTHCYQVTIKTCKPVWSFGIYGVTQKSHILSAISRNSKKRQYPTLFINLMQRSSLTTWIAVLSSLPE